MILAVLSTHYHRLNVARQKEWSQSSGSIGSSLFCVILVDAYRVAIYI